MNDPIAAALIGATGGLVVWCLSWLWILWSERRQRFRVRAMISIEIDDNFTHLRSLLANAQSRVTFTNAQHLGTMQKLDALAYLPLSTPRHAIWEALAALVPSALTEEEIRIVFRLHRDFDDLMALKAQVLSASPSDLKRKLEKEVTRVLQTKNPLSG